MTLDGVLSEAAWTRATPATDFRQQEPDEGAPATERTEVRVVYDANQLYIGAMLFDSDPSGIIGFQKERDQGLGSDDRFMWILDTFRDGRTAYFFETNPPACSATGCCRGAGATSTKTGTASGTCVSRGMNWAGRSRSGSRSGLLTSTPPPTSGGSTSSAPCAARTKRRSGAGTFVTRTLPPDPCRTGRWVR